MIIRLDKKRQDGFTILKGNKEKNGFENLYVSLDSKDTRNGFNHYATMQLDDLILTTKIHYINRTWECYEYQSIIHKIINQVSSKVLNKKQKARLIKRIDAKY